MNALPLKPRVSLKQTIDDLIADYGVRPVLLTLIRRVLKRSRPPDAVYAPLLKDQPGIDALDDRLREDIGLPPIERPKVHVDMSVLFKRDIF